MVAYFFFCKSEGFKMMATNNKQKGDYGQEMSGMIRALLIIGSICIIIGIILYLVSSHGSPDIVITLIASGIVALSYSAFGVWSSRVGKLIIRDHVINIIAWKGNETVLDVGCGHGLILVGAAKRLTSGKAYGIDNFQSTFEYNYTRDRALVNVRAEGVQDRVDIQTADAQELPFSDNMFDVVASSLAIHHVSDMAKALTEMVRVLKPGGTIIIVDVSMMTGKYTKILKNLGMTIVGNERTVPLFLFPFRIITASLLTR